MTAEEGAEVHGCYRAIAIYREPDGKISPDVLVRMLNHVPKHLFKPFVEVLCEAKEDLPGLN